MRSLKHARAFTLAAVLTLAVGIAVVVAMFTVYWGVVLNPVSLPEPETAVGVARVVTDRGSLVPTSLSWPRVEALRRGSTSFAAVGAYENAAVSLSTPGDAARDLRGLRVSEGFFEALRITPLRGRLFLASDDVPNGPAVCILSAEAWERYFGSREMVGRTIRLGGRSTEVVGILPPHLSAPWTDREIFLPRVFDDEELTPQAVAAGASYLSVVGRLAAGRTIAQATADLHGLTTDYQSHFAGRSDALNELEVHPLANDVTANRGTTLSLLLAAVGVVLLVACANAAALFLSRLVSRRREIAVRQALGATRSVILRQLLGESLLLASIAAAIGLVLAAGALKVIGSSLAADLPPGLALRIDGPALAAAGVASAVAAVIVGLLPALQMTRSGSAPITGFVRGMSDTAATQRVRSALVVCEVALSAFLLIGAALSLVSLQRARQSPLGFEPAGLAAGAIALPPERYGDAERQATFFTNLLQRAQHQSGVEGAAIVFGLPFDNDNYVSPYVVAGRNIPPAGERRRAGLRSVTEDYFSVMRMRLLAGRFFTATDRAGGHPVCLVNDSFARREFSGRSAIGATILRGRDADQPFEIIGVVADVKTNGPVSPVPDEIFLPFRQVPRPNASLLIRTAGRADAMGRLLQADVTALDPDLPLSGFATMNQRLQATIGPERILAGLTTGFAGVALLLAAIGLYAVLAHSVTARTVEIGIRMAVGAGRGSILQLVLTGAMRLVAIGIAAGLLAAAAVSRVLQSQLHDVSAHDPAVYLLVAGVFAAVGAAAAIVPAHRASRVDPLVSLTASS